MRLVAAIGIALLLLACNPVGADRVIVRSDEYPSIEIVCQGRPLLASAACVSWAVEVLRSTPGDAGRSVRVVLTNWERRGARCTADFEDAGGSIFASAAAGCRPT